MTSRESSAARKSRPFTQALALVLAMGLAWAPAAWAERTQLKPGWNVFSPQQDVQIGQNVSQDAERQLVMLNDRRVDSYVDRLGKRLAAKAPGENFPYQFKVVNDRGINAFALPGGYIYVNRGIIERADNEAQLAGVIGHEIGHVALRHGTNQATKAYFTQGLLGILGGVMGSSSVGAIATQLGAGFVASSVLLKYSRDAERQADIIGTQILYDNNYDPRAMSQFFEKIQAESKGGRPPEFFSSHPNPENREVRVNEEVDKLGGPPRNYRSDSAEFREIKRYVLSLPAPPKAGTGAQPRSSSDSTSRPPQPSDRYATFENRVLRIRYPDNWEVGQQGDSFTIVPPGGIIQDSRGNQLWAYGIIVSLYEPHTDRYGQITLEAGTDQLVEELRRQNPRLRIARRHERVRIAGQAGLSTYLTNDSPIGGREYNWLVTVMREEGVLYFLCIAPENEYDNYERSFQTMLESVRFRR
jgi:Zn-dependent protease with chaperone function